MLDQTKDLIQKYRFDEANKNLESLGEEYDVDKKIFQSQILRMKGKNKEALELADQALNQSQNKNYKIYELEATVAKAYALVRLGKHKETMKIIEHAEKILETMKKEERETVKELQATIFHVQGIAHSMEGKIERALTCTHKGLDIREELGLKGDIGYSLNNLGWSYYLSGELDLSLEYHRKSLAIREDNQNRIGIAHSLSNIGATYWEMGELGNAFDSLTQALVISKESRDTYLSSSILLRLVELTLEMNQIDQANGYRRQLQEMDKNSNSLYVNSASHLVEALILKNSNRLRHKMDAQEILEKIVAKFDDPELTVSAIKHPCRELRLTVGQVSNDPELIVRAIKHLCDLYLLELKTSGEELVLQQAIDLAKTLYEIGRKTYFFSVSVEALVLQAKFALLEGDIQRSQSLLSQAGLTAVEKGLKRLEKMVKEEQSVLEADFERWLDLINENASMRERIEQAQLEDHIKQAIALRNV
ncbi:MAG: tetratricopeptide repeat protein [Candidatus Thorarchaeota archaeon]